MINHLYQIRTLWVFFNNVFENLSNPIEFYQTSLNFIKKIDF
jgi:hypothetical protein